MIYEKINLKTFLNHFVVSSSKFFLILFLPLLAGARLMHFLKRHFAKPCSPPSPGFLHLIITKLNVRFLQAQDVKTPGSANPEPANGPHMRQTCVCVGGQRAGLPTRPVGAFTEHGWGEIPGKHLAAAEVRVAPRPPTRQKLVRGFGLRDRILPGSASAQGGAGGRSVPKPRLSRNKAPRSDGAPALSTRARVSHSEQLSSPA